MSALLTALAVLGWALAVVIAWCLVRINRREPK